MTKSGNDANRSFCWCCGADKPETNLVRLGARPEAAVCIACVDNLRHRARAKDDPSALVQPLINCAGQIRGKVIALGLHRQPVIGPALRWINRHSPF